MKDARVPIVLAIDENYILQAAVAIYSLLSKGLTNKESLIVILIKGEISKDGLSLLEILKKKYAYCEFKIISVDDSIFSFVELQTKRLTNTTLYRLILPEILNQYKQCIYLDADTLVTGDISELLDIDMSGVYLAGVIDKKIQEKKEYEKEIGLPHLKEYINAGVLVMNLELIRKEEKSKEFLALINNKYLFDDQDVLNISCYGHIKILPTIYNYFASYEDKGLQVRILHFPGGNIDRPWLNIHTKYAKAWWGYASLFKQTFIYKKTYQEALRLPEHGKFRNILEQCRKYKSVYIWGYTKYGRDLLDGLNRNGVCCVAGFIDNNLDKQKEIYRNVKVYSSEAVEYREECLIINVAQRNRDSVNLFLKEKGVKEANILQYYIKSANYFQVLDESYFIEEFRDYILKEYGVDRKL